MLHVCVGEIILVFFEEWFSFTVDSLTINKVKKTPSVSTMLALSLFLSSPFT